MNSKLLIYKQTHCHYTEHIQETNVVVILHLLVLLQSSGLRCSCDALLRTFDSDSISLFFFRSLDRCIFFFLFPFVLVLLPHSRIEVDNFQCLDRRCVCTTYFSLCLSCCLYYPGRTVTSCRGIGVNWHCAKEMSNIDTKQQTELCFVSCFVFIVGSRSSFFRFLFSWRLQLSCRKEIFESKQSINQSPRGSFPLAV